MITKINGKDVARFEADMDQIARNFAAEARAILAGTSRLLPCLGHLAALQRIIAAQDATIAQLQMMLKSEYQPKIRPQ